MAEPLRRLPARVSAGRGVRTGPAPQPSESQSQLGGGAWGYIRELSGLPRLSGSATE